MSIRAYNAPVSPTPDTVEFAQKVIHEMDQPGASFALVDRLTGRELPLGEQMRDLVRQLMLDLAQNRAVSIVPLDHELTPNQAADILNVSRGYVLNLIDQGDLNARMVGSHRRIKLEDLLAYKERADADHERDMRELAGIGQDLGLE